jgi:hypothetical protein
MKKIHFLTVFLMLFLISCGGSDSYQGKWKATDESGAKFEISFAENEFKVKDDAGKTVAYQYTQHSIQHKNSESTYGIELEDGRKYAIYFPSSDESTAYIIDGAGRMIYTISRDEYKTSRDVYKLN